MTSLSVRAVLVMERMPTETGMFPYRSGACLRLEGLRFAVWCLGFKARGLGFSVQGLDFPVSDFGCRVEG